MTTTRFTKLSAVPVAAMLAAAVGLLLLAPVENAHAQAPKGGGAKGGATKGAAKGGQAKGPEIGTLKVQGNVYMIAAPGGNVVVQTGSWGVLVVDTPAEGFSDAVIAEIRKLSDKPIRYLIDTGIDHTATNAQISRAGAPITGGNLGAVAFENGATIVAHENVLNRMIKVPEGQKEANPDALPTTTFNDGQKEIFFNDEPVITIFQPHAHADGDSIVFFRRSDVIAAGDVFNMRRYPKIEVDKGGSVQGVLKALNLILDLCIPQHEQEGGTYVIPGDGRLTDEHDVLEYRDMVTIIRDRIQDGIKKGQSLAQIKANKPTYEYDPRWGATSGDWTTDMFIEAVYKSLGGK